MVKLRIKADLSNRVYHFTTLSSKASQMRLRFTTTPQKVSYPVVHFSYDDLVHRLVDLKKWQKLRVPTDRIVGTESTVDFEPDHRSEYKPFPSMVDAPVVFTLDGQKFFVLDGHHRIEKLVREGNPIAECYVVTYSAERLRGAGITEHTLTNFGA
jgi:hypothetical protein